MRKVELESIFLFIYEIQELGMLGASPRSWLTRKLELNANIIVSL
jgi:hypothetical protein